MRAGAIIYPILSSFSNLTSLVAASNIFAVRASQGTNAPYIVYREISNTPTNTKGTGDGTADPKINQRSILDVSTIKELNESILTESFVLRLIDFSALNNIESFLALNNNLLEVNITCSSTYSLGDSGSVSYDL